jgi:hypothetical protein
MLNGDFADAHRFAVAAHWDGTSWTTVGLPVPAGADHSDGLAVAATSGNDVWVGGTYLDVETVPIGERALIEHWDGQQWHLAGVPVGGLIRAIAALSPGDVWAVGVYAASTYAPGATLVEHWDGTAWTVLTQSGSVGYRAATVDGQGGMIAVGSGETDDVPPQSISVATRWNGTGAHPLAVPPVPSTGGGDEGMTSVALADPTDGWAGAYRADRMVRWDGVSWQDVDLPQVPGRTTAVVGLSALSTTDVWAVGSSRDDLAQNSTGLTEHWDGAQWSIVPSSGTGGYDQLNDVAAIASDDVWAVGQTTGTTPAPSFLEHWDGTAWTLAGIPLATTTY